jgi:hypothetical protein
MRGDIISKNVEVVRIQNHLSNNSKEVEPYSKLISVVNIQFGEQLRTISLPAAYLYVPEIIEKFLEVNKDKLENYQELVDDLHNLSPKESSRKFQVRVSGPAVIHDTDEDSEEERYRVPDNRNISIYDYKDISVLYVTGSIRNGFRVTVAFKRDDGVIDQ